MDEAQVARAAEVVAAADAIVVTAGAGIGVDSGLPDFRGDEGFWNAYPPYRELGVSFVDMANPRGFREDPELAWGFYGHRRALYRRTVPHEGFAVLRRWIQAAPAGGAVFTSNVDGQFQAAGVAGVAGVAGGVGKGGGGADTPVYECHGSIHVDQCLQGCGQPIWDAAPGDLAIDPGTMRAVGPLPSCPRCGGLARPNILMFGDWGWDPSRADAQAAAFEQRLASFTRGRVVVVEVGAGTALPTVRRFGERLTRTHGATLVRIDPREPSVPAGHIGLAAGGREALLEVAAALDVGV